MLRWRTQPRSTDQSELSMDERSLSFVWSASLSSAISLGLPRTEPLHHQTWRSRDQVQMSSNYVRPNTSPAPVRRPLLSSPLRHPARALTDGSLQQARARSGPSRHGSGGWCTRSGQQRNRQSPPARASCYTARNGRSRQSCFRGRPSAAAARGSSRKSSCLACSSPSSSPACSCTSH